MSMDNQEYNVVAREIEKNLAGMDLDDYDDGEGKLHTNII
jgi:hypothetical protein